MKPTMVKSNQTAGPYSKAEGAQPLFQENGRVVSSSHRLRKQSSQMDVSTAAGMIWLIVCFIGILASFVMYGIILEYATSEGRRLHELSLIFVTSLLYSGTAYVGSYVRAEKPTTVAPSRLMLLAVTSMGSTYCSVRSLRYVIYPVQVLAKSCKPIPVMLMGALMGKRYPVKKYFNVAIITAGVAMFMMGKQKSGAKGKGNTTTAGAILLFVSLCFDGGTGAYEDKLMGKHHMGPFDLMYNMHLGKAILAGIGLIVLGQINYFIVMCHSTGILLLLLGVSGAFGQVFIFVTIAKFGALTCSIMGLARKVVTLMVSIYIYGHSLNGVQTLGLVVSFATMISGFCERRTPGQASRKRRGTEHCQVLPRHEGEASEAQGRSCAKLEVAGQVLELPTLTHVERGTQKQDEEEHLQEDDADRNQGSKPR